MGFSISWLAIRGKDPASVCNELALRGTGEHEEIPESPLLGAELPSGWYLVFANHCGFADTQPLAKLSSDAEIVTCSVEEHVMYSGASCWKHGKRMWSITHDSQQGIEHLEAEGQLPPVFAPIRDQMTARQADRDDADYIFDVPVEVAKSLTGFRHDKDIEGAPDKPFERLEKLNREKRWWEFWK
jgi:hypothetical protein